MPEMASSASRHVQEADSHVMDEWEVHRKISFPIFRWSTRFNDREEDNEPMMGCGNTHRVLGV